MPFPMKKIMVYIDGSEQSLTACQYAIALSKTTQSELFALYVVNTKALSELVRSRIFLQSEQEEYQKDIEEDAKRYLNYVQNISRKKGVAVTAISKEGTVHLEIKNIVEQYKIDLLIVGEVSKIRSRRDEFYNETERAMRNVNCSVLIVKDEDYVSQIYDML